MVLIVNHHSAHVELFRFLGFVSLDYAGELFGFEPPRIARLALYWGKSIGFLVKRHHFTRSNAHLQYFNNLGTVIRGSIDHFLFFYLSFVTVIIACFMYRKYRKYIDIVLFLTVG